MTACCRPCRCRRPDDAVPRRAQGGAAAARARAASRARLTVTATAAGISRRVDGRGRAAVRRDLLALSIGSYVCQARAAKQSDQAVRDYVTAVGPQRRAQHPD